MVYTDLDYLHRINSDILVEDVVQVMDEFIFIVDWSVAGDIIARTHAVAPLSAVQNVYSILERGVGEVGYTVLP